MSKEVKNYHLIEIKYLGATNTRGPRVKLTSKRFNQSIIIPFDYSFNTCEDMAIDYLLKNGHKIQGKADKAIILTANKQGCFKPLKQY